MGMKVVVAYALSAHQVLEVGLELPMGATVAQALAASGIMERYPEAKSAPLGIWGRKATAERTLRAGDRVEVYRPLRVDPKVARRERFAKQGAGTAGLFAKRRAGAKAGY
jgi:putative ubiquitin-RnfH superfamily antitoxin RatB of RatAB toxin-antitoxin module